MSSQSNPRPVGSYLLVIELGKDIKIEIGRLGPVAFRKGTYVYSGSAKSGLLPRLKRHFSSDKKTHWHIDYLLRKGRPVYAFTFDNERASECALSQLIADLPGSYSIEGFGSSDCKCHTHLHMVDPKELGRIEEIFPDAKRLSAIDFE